MVSWAVFIVLRHIHAHVDANTEVTNIVNRAYQNSDMKTGVTYNGISVNHRENARFEITINSQQHYSYKRCNLVESVQLISPSNDDLDLKTTCPSCDGSIVAVINSQLKELIKSKLNEQILDGLRWHLIELVSSQQFSGPIPFRE